MQDYEKLGVFYLGRRYDLDKRACSTDLLYDSKDLLTHAVCVGMTGSGKTGLCIGMIEEAAIDGIPAILVDPKGDLGNLLLTFPDLQASDFQPWVNTDEARNKGVPVEQYAAEQAERWRKGLADWDQDGERIRRLKQAADFAIYTPASTAGRPVSVMRSFAAPPEAILDDREAFRERVAATSSSILSLAGIEGDPVQSREHILLSNIFDRAWRAGKDLDLAAVIQQIQSPPFAKIGVLDLESFYPSKDRFALAMQINNLLASPGFEAWMEGEPLDIAQILYTPEGKPRIAIFSISHLSDSERMFFVSLLLNQLLGWVRTQSGTTSLRALFYMDEIFGYFPPVSNPPSKGPLLTLLKQARAFGLGVVLATQNPVDLDYKGLSNTGTWFIGRLQTERDKARLLDGLEGALAASGAKFDRDRLDKILSGLGSRVFLMNNVHEDAPEVFQTRWTLSYLRGPMTKQEIKKLAQTALATPQTSTPAPKAAPPAPSAATAAATSRPVLPPGIPEHFVPAQAATPLVYKPMLLGAAQVHFVDTKAKVDITRDVVAVTEITCEAVPVNWDNALALDLAAADLESEPADGATFDEPAPAASKPKSYATWSKDFTSWVFRTEKLTLMKSPATGLLSAPAETERDFRIRLQQAAREERDAQAEALRRKYAPKVSGLEERLRRAQLAQEREAAQAREAQLSTAMSVGSTLLGALFGRKTFSASTINRAGTAARKASKTWREGQDVERAAETVAAVQEQLEALNFELETELASLDNKIDATTEALDTVEIRAKKTNIGVKLVCLAWVPQQML